MEVRVAVVGATGNVGQEMLAILAERTYPVSEVFAIASRQSIGRELSFGDKTLKCVDLEQFDFSKADIALFAAGGSIAKEWAPKAAAAGCTVIDNSSFFRMDPDVPLIVPEVNADAVAGFTKKNIIANPNCSTAQIGRCVETASRCSDNKARRRFNLSVDLRRRQSGDGRALEPDQADLRHRRAGTGKVHQANRI